ncbi:MAG: nuclear transport factor 2 family protein, partial [Candidatus Bathyarchaeia archaeon]
MNNADSSEEIRRAAMTLDKALESRDLQLVTEKFTDDCEIELLSIKLLGKEGVRKWVNWMYKHVAEIKFLPVTIMVEGNKFFEEFIVEAKFHDGEKARSNQTVVLEFEELKVKSLRMYFDRLDFS